MSVDLPTLQTNFNAGEIDPLLASRVDIEQYYQGAKYLRNAFVVPQGGTKRRPGTKFINDVNTAGRGRLVSFEYGLDGSKYLFVFSDDKLQIFENDAVVFTTVVAGETYDRFELPNITWIQNDELLITFHEDHEPRRYVRGATSASWTIEDIPWLVIPQHHFEDTAGSNTDHVHELGFINFVNASPSDRFTIFVNGEETLPIEADNVTATMAANIKTGVEALRSVDTVSVAFISGGLGAAVGLYQITFSGTEVSGKEFTVTEGDANLDGVAQDNIIIDTIITKGSLPKEDVWSATRGFPACGVFFQGRLWMAGSKERPQTIWASQSGSIYSFNDEEDLDNFAINVTIEGAGELAIIRQMFVGRHLQIFSSEAEYYIPESDVRVITPQNIVIRRTTSRGILRGSQVFDVDGATLFLDREGRSLRRFVFDDSEQSYTAENLSLLSSQIFNDPIIGSAGVALEMSFRKSTSTEEADYVLVVCSAGHLAVYCTLFSQNVSAWTAQHMRGNIENVGVLDGEMYLLVDRGEHVENSPWPAHNFLEKFDDSRHFDASTTGTGVASSATLVYMDGAETGRLDTHGDAIMGVILDGNIMDEDKDNEKLDVGGGGVVNFDSDSVATWETGIWFGTPGASLHSVAGQLTEDTGHEVLIETLPIESNDFGTLIGKLMRLRDVALRLNSTQHMKIRNSAGSAFREILFRELPTVLGNPAPSFTGDQRVKGLLGKSLAPTLQIIQTTSLDMHILGVAITASI